MDIEQEAQKWCKLCFILPNEAIEVVMAEIERIKSSCMFRTKSETIKNGLALELMALNSAGIPIESLI